MQEIFEQLKSTKLVIFDSDGVLVEEGVPLPGVKELVDWLHRQGKRCVVLSNNSTTHPQDMKQHYNKNGIIVDKVINSGLLSVEYLIQEHIESVYVVGEEGLEKIVKEHGISVAAKESDAVLVGMDRTLTYEKLAIATRLIRSGARFIATNPDKSFPTPRGLEPGAGSMIAALEASTDQIPEIIVGKPSNFGYKYVLDQMNCEPGETIMIGDRYETDIIGAVNSGIFSVVVNTGVAASRSKPNSWPNYPDVPLIQSLSDLIR